MRRLLCLMLAMMLLGIQGAAGEWIVEEEDDAPFPDRQAQARVLMRDMSLEDKVWQLLLVSPEALTKEKITTALGKENVFRARPVGGVVIFGQNISSESQLKGLTGDLQRQAKSAGVYPLLIGVTEEGGAWSRVANKLGYEKALSVPEIGASGDPEQAGQAGEKIGKYLKPLGINLDFAPVCDVLTAEDAWIKPRLYGSNPGVTADMALRMAQGLRSQGIIPCFSHFPGQGSINGNLNNRSVVNTRGLADMQAVDWFPFRKAVEEGAGMIMVSNAPSRAAGDGMPACLSPVVIGQWLRQDLGYQGVVVTDSLRMGAITSLYKPGTAAVEALKAGADLLLLPANADIAVSSILRAVRAGDLTEERINESVERILALKIDQGVIQ